jgi:hypothetical protein
VRLSAGSSPACMSGARAMIHALMIVWPRSSCSVLRCAPRMHTPRPNMDMSHMETTSTVQHLQPSNTWTWTSDRSWGDRRGGETRDRSAATPHVPPIRAHGEHVGVWPRGVGANELRGRELPPMRGLDHVRARSAHAAYHSEGSITSDEMSVTQLTSSRVRTAWIPRWGPVGGSGGSHGVRVAAWRRCPV